MSDMPRRRRLFGRAPRLPLAYVILLTLLACVAGLSTGAVLMRLGWSPPEAVLTRLPPSHTPAPSPLPTLVPSFTPLPSATPTVTPQPPARIEAADAAMAAGDWGRAQAEYQAVLAESSESELQAAAQLGLAQARLKAGDAAGAISGLTAYLDAEADPPLAAEAYFILGDACFAAGRWAEAMAAYQAYLERRPNVLASYVYASVAQAAVNLGDYAAASAALESAIAAPRAGDTFDLQEQLAEVYAANGQLDQAVARYDAVYLATDQNWRKARVTVRAGHLLYQAGQTQAAYARFLDAVNNYPEAAVSLEGLVILVNDGVPVDDLQRGLTNFYGANHGPARDALERYHAAFLAGEASTNAAGDATALYHLGRAYAALGDNARALAAWRELLDAHPESSYWTQAYFQIAFLQPYPDDVETFTAFAAAAPSAPEAPDALYRAARLHERNNRFAEAAALWTRIAEEYPTAAQAADAAMQAGLVFYRNGEFGSAGLRFAAARDLAADDNERARAWLWLGKARQAMGDAAAARAAWTLAAGLGPHGYYALRAGQLLRGEAPFTPPAAYAFTFDEAAERAETEAWLRAEFPLAQGVDRLSELQPGVWQEPRFTRGAELWQLGRLTQAHAEFNSLRLALAGDPLATWQLAVYFHQLGAYDLAIRAARQVVDLAGLSDSLLAPRYILRLRYPAPFSGLVVEAANTYGLHPFLMYAKMRIESFFWKYAYSVADARGLNQFIPTTAMDVSARLGLAGFTLDDLYRPAISIPMGAYYLRFVDDQTGGGPAGMLAGYYAGPGNAAIWLNLAGDDYDLFVEVIRLPDAKGYVTATFEYFEEYRELYGE